MKENGEYFIDFIKAGLGELLSMLTRVLLNDMEGIEEREFANLLNTYEMLVGKCIVEGHDDVRPGILKVYQEMLISMSNMRCAQDSVTCYLNGPFLSRFALKEETAVSMKTDMAIALANAKKMFSITLPWIIHYFSQTKTATIDLNRYKLEAFLMTNEHPDVNEMICNALFDPNCYIREHMSDIIGEKRINMGVSNLCKQLRNEENYYTAVSMIEALGKLNDTTALPYIVEWLSAKERNIISEKQFFVLNHARIAIKKLDTVGDVLHEFNEKYAVYLKDYFIL